MITKNLQLGLKSKYWGLVGLFLILWGSTLQGQSPVSISATTIDATVASTIQGHLNSGTSVIVESANANADLVFNSGVSITKSTGGDASLTFKSARQLYLNSNVNIQSTSGKLHLVFWTNSNNTGGILRFGTGSVDANVLIETNGGHFWAGGGSGSTTWNGLTVGDGFALGGVVASGSLPWWGLELYGGTRIYTQGGDVQLKGASQSQPTTVGVRLIRSLINAGAGSIDIQTDVTGVNGGTNAAYGVWMEGDGGFSTTTGNIQINNTLDGQAGTSTGVLYTRTADGLPIIVSSLGNVTIESDLSAAISAVRWFFDIDESSFPIEKASTAVDFTQTLPAVLSGATSTFYSSSNGVATVDNDGLVSIVGLGNTTLTGVFNRNDWNLIPSRWRYQIAVVNKADPQLSFAQLEVVKDLSDPSFTLAATQGNQGGGTYGSITYASSNRSVATVNPSTGEITLIGEGSSIISATSVSTVTYAQGNANYSLLVTNGLVVVTSSATNNNGVVTVNGNVVSDGGSAISERGFVYSSNINPTIADNKVTVAGATGTFSGSTPNLGGGTFYFRAFATNNNGTVYGSEISLNIVGSVIWVGGVSNDWNDAANWNPNVVPSALIDAEIPIVIQGNVYPVVSNGVNAATKNLIVSSTSVAESIQVEDGASLTIHGTYTVSDGAGVKVMGSQIIP